MESNVGRQSCIRDLDRSHFLYPESSHRRESSRPYEPNTPSHPLCFLNILFHHFALTTVHTPYPAYPAQSSNS